VDVQLMRQSLGNQSKLCADELVRTNQGPPTTQASKARRARMFGIPGDIFWPTAALGVIISLVFGGVALLRFLPKSRVADQPERETLEDLQVRLRQLDQLQERLGELEERVDFAERLLAKPREGERLGLPED
jgi:hypothetical protein